MKRLKTSAQYLLNGLLFLHLMGQSTMAIERPFILIGETHLALKEKIHNHAWAQSIFNKISQSVDPYVDRHKSDPEWIVSRLQMHWKTHYERTFVNGQIWSHGQGRAPVPTPRFAGGRDWATPYARPALEDIRPFEEDPRGLWLQNRQKPGEPWEWASVSETGQVIERINEHLMRLAEQAAFLYWYTGDESYAQFAADIFYTYVEGMYYRSNPETVEDHSKARILGLATFEVIHEAITRSLAITYDFLRDYLVQNGKDIDLVESVFKRWADRIIQGGNAHGNWNINQARFIVYLGLSLQPDDAYADGKGLTYYVDQFTRVSSENQTSLKDMVPVEYDQAQGIWPEAPGYAFSVTDNILQLAHVIRNATHEDVIEAYPVLEKAALVVFQYLFPNGLTVGFGDTYHQAPNPVTLELLVNRARKNGELALERRLTAALKQQMVLSGYVRGNRGALFSLTSFVGELLPSDQINTDLVTKTFYAPPVSLAIQRNGNDLTLGLMASLVGTKGGHMHSNGLALELYGQDLVFAPDVGRGSSYWQKEHGEYYKRFLAHNTVIVDGKSDYDGPDHPFQLLHLEPTSESYQSLSDRVSFVDVYFEEPKTQSDQRRLVRIIRTSPESGYFVDILRSKRQDGKDVKHEYLFHNLGQTLVLNNANGNGLATVATDELHAKRGDLVGYNYFTHKQKADYNDDFFATFHIELENAKEVTTRLWMAGEIERTVFTALSPRARSPSHGSAPRELQDDAVPLLFVRQLGLAWTRPFVGVIEPFADTRGASISHIETLEGEGDFVGLQITSQKLNHRTEYILSDTSLKGVNTVKDIQFQGIYGVLSITDGGLQVLYLGHGKHLSAFGFTIGASGETVSACLYRESGRFLLSNTGPIRLQTPLGARDWTPGFAQIVGE
jgi:hypothetical protein